METLLRRFDGEYRWFLERVFPLFDRAGKILGWYGSDIDIHDRKQAEEALKQQEIELRQMLDFAPQLVSVYGPGRERIHANRIQLDYLGIGLDEWRQRSPGFHIHPDDSERAKACWDRALGSGSGFEVELRVRKHDGSYRWILARYNPVRDDKGQIMRWYVAGTDIEDRKQAEEKLQQENAALREEIDRTSMFEEIVGTSSALKNVLSRISKVAPSDSTVLITGETGTGKELVARAIHRRSRRSSRAFVSVNCAAIPRDLIASELFGHEKGAFTGAIQRQVGRFELSDGGTIFLDEIGELLPDTQAALLRVLQEREFERIGGRQSIHVDVRVITATNRDLNAAVAIGAFRQDLFYRLNVFPIEVPPLRERKDDILMLVEYFVQRFATRAGKHIRSIDRKTLDLLQSYAWPGNIRELQNVIERSLILSSGEVLSVDELWLSKETRVPASRVKAQPTVRDEVEPRSEREIIEAALAETKGRVSGPSGAAVKLGIPSSTLATRIKALKINKGQFKFRA
jgi:formate hydrogenlyase transcriptional activator